MEEPHFQEIGAEGIAWVRECLESGELLSHAVLSNINLDNGVLFLAITTDEHRIAASNHHPFGQGALTSKVISTKLPAKLLLERLSTIEKNSNLLAIIVEDNLRDLGDPILENYQTGKRYILRDKFLNIMDIASIQTPDDLVKLLNQSSGYPLNAFVVLAKDVPEKGSLSVADIETLASSTNAIINFAFDGETYTLWLAHSINR